MKYMPKSGMKCMSSSHELLLWVKIWCSSKASAITCNQRNVLEEYSRSSILRVSVPSKDQWKRKNSQRAERALRWKSVQIECNTTNPWRNSLSIQWLKTDSSEILQLCWSLFDFNTPCASSFIPFFARNCLRTSVRIAALHFSVECSFCFQANGRYRWRNLLNITIHSAQTTSSLVMVRSSDNRR